MKRVFAVTLLLMSFASVAFADGPGTAPPPGQATKPVKPALLVLADGPGTAPPPGQATKAVKPA